MPENRSENGGRAVPLGTKRLKRETIQNWMGVAFNSASGQFGALKHLVEEHRGTIEAIVGKHCPEVAVRCEDLQPVQRQIDGYFSLLQGEANSRPEQELIAHERKEYGSIVERIQHIFAVQESVVAPPIERKEGAPKASAMPVEKFRAIWDKHFGAAFGRMRTWQQKEDGIIKKLRAGFQELQVDWPPQAIDNMVYIEHLQESTESLLDETEEMIISAGEDQRQLFHCFDLLIARRRPELEQALRNLSQKNFETFNQLCEAIGMPPAGIDPAIAVRDVIDRVRPMLEQGLVNLNELASDLRRGVTDLFAETEAVVAQEYSLKTRKDITEPMAWRSEFLEEMEEELGKREEKDNKTIWFKDDRLKGDVWSKWKRFTEGKHLKQYEKAEAEFVESIRRLVQTVPPLLRRADLERLQGELKVIAGKYNEMVATRVTPHAGKAVAKVLTNRFDVMRKSVGFKGDSLLLTADIGRSGDNFDYQLMTERTDPLTPEEIERILDPFMMRLRRAHSEEYAKLGRRSQAKGNAKAFEMGARMCLRELPKEVLSFDQLFTLLTLPVAASEGSLEFAKRERLLKEGRIEGLGNTLDEISVVVCAREYRKFTEVLRKRTWNVRRHLAAQGRILTPEEEAPTTREGKYSFVTKERMMDEKEKYLRKYQLQNGGADLLGKLEPDLQDRVIVARDAAANRIDDLFAGQGNQISHDELLVLKSRIVAECDELRRSIPETEAKDYFDLFEESYRCVLWHVENAMDFGARVLGWDKQHDLIAAVQGAQGRAAMTGPEEREFALADLSNPGTSNALQVPIPPGFEGALARHPVNASVITREVRRAFGTLEKELPLVLGFGHVDRAARLTPLLNQCRDASLAAVEAGGSESIASVDALDQIFGRLGWIFDQIQNRFRGVMYGFLTERFISLRKRLQEQTLRRVKQEDMRDALSTTNDPRIAAGQYETFFIRYAQNLLTDRCRQFFYSCITPAMNAEQIGQVGAAIEKAVQILLSFLTQRISARCALTKGPIALSDFQQCFGELAALVDISALGLPPGTEERFRAQVLNFLAQDLARISTPEGLIGAYGTPSESEDYSSLLQRAVASALNVREREELLPLRQTAREQHRQCLRYIEAIRGATTALLEQTIEDEPQAHALEKLHHITDALAALRFSLYAPAEEQTSTSGNDFDQCMSHLEALQAALATLLIRIQRSEEDPHIQRSAIETIGNLTDTLKGLLHFLYQKP